jgi:cytochrome d ubiquinol oxidase subunit I
VFNKRWFLWIAALAIPLPWISTELGWVIAEVGRQPWAIDGVLPTGLAASSLSRSVLVVTIVGFTLLYGTMAVIEMGLIIRTIRRGPFAVHEELHLPAPVRAIPSSAAGAAAD